MQAAAVNLADIQRAEELRQRQLEAEEAERRSLVEAQRAELEAIQRQKQQAAASWREKYDDIHTKIQIQTEIIS